MQASTHHSPQVRKAAESGHYPPLANESRPAVETAAAAYYLTRQPQTLRGWACNENGPLRPIRVHGRLMWPTADLKRLLGVTEG